MVREGPFHPFLPEEWNHHTSTMLRTFLIQHLPNPIGPDQLFLGPYFHPDLQDTHQQPLR